MEISTYGMWRGKRMYVGYFDGDGNVWITGQVGKDLYTRALSGEESGVIKVDRTDAYWDIGLWVARENITDITYAYGDYPPVSTSVYR